MKKLLATLFVLALVAPASAETVQNRNGYISSTNPLDITGDIGIESGQSVGIDQTTDGSTNKVRNDPIAKTVLVYSGTKSASGDNIVITAPAAGYRIVLISYRVQNVSVISTTATISDGSGGTEIDGMLLPNQGAYFGDELPPGREYRLTEATAFVLNLDGANSHRIMVKYFVEAV